MRDLLPAERWATLDRLFQAAVEMPAVDREAFVGAECGEDGRLREEVLLLLKYDTEEDAGLLKALQAGAASVVTGDPVSGRMLGPYRIGQEIGRGGMAVVYLGSRADGVFQKQVAVKLIKRGMDTAAVVERLRRERRILAALDHPYIARLLDGGATPEGLPYIVMDYVEGVTIDRYCEQQRLSVRERCELIGKVCEAVAYAHRNLVVHRDLKPGNILVGPDGNPKLLDFGIAKLLTDDGTESAGPDTRTFPRPVTPEYASPEQIQGGSVGTATDVYSLGVVLYELLAGERPRESGGKASETALRLGRGKRWSRRLAGDLDNILLMALRAEPERRYLSPGQLQADLRLYLNGLPVAAREETLGYRCAKFLARHRFGVVAVLAIVLSLAGGMAATLWQARRAAAETRIAEARRADAEREAVASAVARRRAEDEHSEAERQRALADQRFGQVRELASKFLFDFHDSIARLPGSTPARKMVIETGIHYYDSLANEAAGNRDLLEEIARGYIRLGDVQGNCYYANVGDTTGAMESYRKALAVRAKISDSSPAFLSDRLLGQVRLGQAMICQNSYELAAKYLRQAVALAPGAQPAEVRNALSLVWSTLGDAQYETGAYGQAIESFTKMRALRIQLAKEDPGDGNQRGLAVSESKLGDIYTVSGHPSEALLHLKAAREIDERMAAAAPGNTSTTRQLKVTDLLLGTLLEDSGKYLAKPGEAAAFLQEAVRLSDQILAADPQNRRALSDVADSGIALGDSLRDEKDLTGAHAAWDKAMAVAQKLASDEGLLSQLYRRLALAASDEGKYDEALDNLRKAEDHAARAETGPPDATGRVLRTLDIGDSRAEIYVAAKHWQEAIGVLKTNIAALEDLAPREPGNRLLVNRQPVTYARLAGCYAGAGDWGNAIIAMTTAVERYGAIERTRVLFPDEKLARDEAERNLAAWKRK